MYAANEAHKVEPAFSVGYLFVRVIEPVLDIFVLFVISDLIKFFIKFLFALFLGLLLLFSILSYKFLDNVNQRALIAGHEVPVIKQVKI